MLESCRIVILFHETSNFAGGCNECIRAGRDFIKIWHSTKQLNELYARFTNKKQQKFRKFNTMQFAPKAKKWQRPSVVHICEYMSFFLPFIRAKLAALLNLAKSPFLRTDGQIVLYRAIKDKRDVNTAIGLVVK